MQKWSYDISHDAGYYDIYVLRKIVREWMAKSVSPEDAEEIVAACNAYDANQETIRQQAEQIKALREALSVYANAKWGWDGDDNSVVREWPDDVDVFFKDGGAIANNALAQTKGE